MWYHYLFPLPGNNAWFPYLHGTTTPSSPTWYHYLGPNSPTQYHCLVPLYLVPILERYTDNTRVTAANI